MQHFHMSPNSHRRQRRRSVAPRRLSRRGPGGPGRAWREVVALLKDLEAKDLQSDARFFTTEHTRRGIVFQSAWIRLRAHVEGRKMNDPKLWRLLRPVVCWKNEV